MPKNMISDWSSTASDNEDIGGIDIRGTAKPSNFDDAEREMMAQGANHFASDTIASATTTDLGSKAAHYLTISGTTTITGLGTVKAGTLKFVRFSGALTLTHNGTSLILPGGANITTVAGDTAVFVSEGSGNWRCLDYKLVTPLQTGGWELIGTATPSGASSVDFTGLSAYRYLMAVGRMAPATDGSSFLVRTSSNNGSSYDSGASDYPQLSISAAATNVFAASAGALSSLFVTPTGVGNVSGEYVDFSLTLSEFNKAADCEIKTECTYLGTDGSRVRGLCSGKRAQSTARDAVRFLFSSGNGTGVIYLLGLRG